ncbi:ankyrin repeat domain-containing protein [Frigoriglobus tundricola]|uniref:Uncharacterized protein n=1 Tax=Frigoriglobus tundricola TaxID=2774151 RepID=A0A6M5YNH0_9BACT|nr:ankyrin repeat domain-containing protein [Frigoriglobus tundricola]QJW94512.1 hypothetical protein FTUN_2033 [Frigoriglobus tundricola]
MHLPALVVSLFASGLGGLAHSEPLHGAARTGSIIQAHLALLCCPDAVNAPERRTKGRPATPVHIAASGNNVGVLNLLLARGGRVNDPGQSGGAPLQHAARRNSTGTVELLLKHGATLDIFSAVALNRQDDVRLMFRAAGVFGLQKQLANLRSDGPGWGSQTLLTEAVATGDVRMVELLIRHGAEVNPHADPRAPIDWLPLYRAVTAQRIDMVELLIRHGAKVNPYADSRKTLAWTPLHAAVYARRRDIAVFLLQKGAKADAQDCDGSTALHMAVGIGDVEMVRVLLKHGANPNTQRDYYLPRASMPNGDPRTFSTPLHTAIERESLELVALLLANGASLTTRDAMRRNPVDLALKIMPGRMVHLAGQPKPTAPEPEELSVNRALCLKLLLRYGGKSSEQK